MLFKIRTEPVYHALFIDKLHKYDDEVPLCKFFYLNRLHYIHIVSSIWVEIAVQESLYNGDPMLRFLAQTSRSAPIR